MQIVTGILGMLGRWGQKVGPYLMVELLLPGGTVLALLLFLYRRKSTVPSPAFAAPFDRPVVCMAVGFDSPMSNSDTPERL